MLELHGLRIDTLDFDKESGAFVIIEYKNQREIWIITTNQHGQNVTSSKLPRKDAEKEFVPSIGPIKG